VRYRPTSARYKVYIIDEVHMLSKHAFNALLKTLEEPPEHVKFIFATTETRKIPVTVLSRCQRFDLRRIDLDTLIAHFKEICEKEGAAITAGALTLIARAADGSVRDGLSLLDQAIAQSGYSSEQGGDVKGEIDDAMVRDMLGLADRTMTFDLFESVMKGDIRDALGQMDGQYKSGADPVQVIEDMLDLTHWLTRIKVVPDAAEVSGAPEAERVRGREMAEGLSMAAVSRAWQMLLKGLEEVRLAPHPVQAVDMILVRLAHASALPTPAEAIKALKQEQAQSSSSSSSAQSTPAGAPSSPPASPPGSAGTGTESSAPASMPSSPVSPDQPRALASGGAVSALTSAQPSGRPEPEMAVETGVLELPVPDTFAAVVELTSERREALLHANLINNVHLVNFEKGRIEFRPGDRAPSELAHDLSRFLNDHTALRWLVMVSGEPGDATLRQQLDASDAAEKNQAADHPLVRAVMETFPGAAIEKVTKILPPETAVPSEQEIPVPGDET
jgi:DNA polymerase-3 subunit gamma/tau